LFTLTYAQKQNNNWCFGYKAGITFNSGTPVFFNGVMMNQNEGCASASDVNGNLLFYTDGLTVWNRNHVTMSNGTGLGGDVSSTQSAIIIKQPGNANMYYIFTTVAWGYSGLKYTQVDISLNGGLGGVTAVKNVSLYTP